MSTIFGLINNLKTIKQNIYTSLVGKGVVVGENNKLEDVPAYIDGITTGGGITCTLTDGRYFFYNNVRLGDIDNLKNFFGEFLRTDYMFASNSNTSHNGPSLTAIINNLNLTKCTDISYMFSKANFYNTTGTIILNVPEALNVNNFMETYGLHYITKLVLQNSRKIKNWSQFLYVGFGTNATANKALQELELDMSACENTNYMFHSPTATYSNLANLNKITFTGSFGGNSTVPALTLDIAKIEGMTLQSIVDMFTSLSPNTNLKIRYIKINSAIYNALTPEQIAIATNKGYTVTA